MLHFLSLWMPRTSHNSISNTCDFVTHKNHKHLKLHYSYCRYFKILFLCITTSELQSLDKLVEHVI